MTQIDDRGAASETQAQAVLDTVRGVLSSAGVRAGDLLVSKGDELSTMTGIALTATANVGRDGC